MSIWGVIEKEILLAPCEAEEGDSGFDSQGNYGNSSVDNEMGGGGPGGRGHDGSGGGADSYDWVNPDTGKIAGSQADLDAVRGQEIEAQATLYNQMNQHLRALGSPLASPHGYNDMRDMNSNHGISPDGKGGLRFDDPVKDIARRAGFDYVDPASKDYRDSYDVTNSLMSKGSMLASFLAPPVAVALDIARKGRQVKTSPQEKTMTGANQAPGLWGGNLVSQELKDKNDWNDRSAVNRYGNAIAGALVNPVSSLVPAKSLGGLVAKQGMKDFVSASIPSHDNPGASFGRTVDEIAGKFTGEVGPANQSLADRSDHSFGEGDSPEYQLQEPESIAQTQPAPAQTATPSVAYNPEPTVDPLDFWSQYDIENTPEYKNFLAYREGAV